MADNLNDFSTLLKRYNDHAESCLVKFKELINTDPVEADKYFLEGRGWIEKSKGIVMERFK